MMLCKACHPYFHCPDGGHAKAFARRTCQACNTTAWCYSCLETPRRHLASKGLVAVSVRAYRHTAAVSYPRAERTA